MLVAGRPVVGRGRLRTEVRAGPRRRGDRAGPGRAIARRRRCGSPGGRRREVQLRSTAPRPPDARRLRPRARRRGRLARLRAAHPLVRAARGGRAGRSTPSRSWPGGCAAGAPRPGWRSPARTARPRPPRCWPRSCARPACAPRRWATSASRWSRGRSTPGRFDVLAVELSSFQLHWSSTLAPQAGALLNLADDHLEWHGTLRRLRAGQGWRSGARPRSAAVGDRQPRRPAGRPALLAAVAGRRVGVTLGEPGPGAARRGRRALVDRAFGDRARASSGRRRRSARPGRTTSPTRWTRRRWPAAYGVRAGRGRGPGWPATCPEPHRNALVATVDGVAYVDDSKATNPHAASASLPAYPRIVWIAGGQLKGVDLDDLVAAVADRLTGAVLLGVDRAEVAAALADTPRASRSSTWPGPMMAPWPRWSAAAAALGAPGRHRAARAGRRVVRTCSPATATAVTPSPRRCAAAAAGEPVDAARPTAWLDASGVARASAAPAPRPRRRAAGWPRRAGWSPVAAARCCAACWPARSPRTTCCSPAPGCCW